MHAWLLIYIRFLFQSFVLEKSLACVRKSARKLKTYPLLVLALASRSLWMKAETNKRINRVLPQSTVWNCRWGLMVQLKLVRLHPACESRIFGSVFNQSDGMVWYKPQATATYAELEKISLCLCGQNCVSLYSRSHLQCAFIVSVTHRGEVLVRKSLAIWPSIAACELKKSLISRLDLGQKPMVSYLPAIIPWLRASSLPLEASQFGSQLHHNSIFEKPV